MTKCEKYKKWKIFLAMFAIFIAGAISGVVGTGMFIKHKVHQFLSSDNKAKTQIIVKRLDHKLGLDQTQERQVSEIVSEADKEITEFRCRHYPELQKILAKHKKRLDEVLTDEQRSELDRMHKKLKEHLDPKSRR